MQRKRYSEEQIVGILKQWNAGAKVADLCREHGVSEPTLYVWRSKYAGIEVSDLRRLKGLEEENRKLKHLVADLTLDNQALKAVVSKNF